MNQATALGEDILKGFKACGLLYLTFALSKRSNNMREEVFCYG